ncbi:winged helix-turn-helix transcriptional regulator [Dyadobacter arcticus]|nr:helix-turn-helix domain-containing protein [Dyadobacter arcticus]
MPDFIYDNRLYYNPMEFALHFIGGTWKMPILWRLNKKMMRYSELKKTLPHITHKMLSSQLRELEGYGLIERKAYPVVPPKVEYTITDKGRDVIPVIETISQYGYTIMKEKGISIEGHKAEKVQVNKNN